MHTHLPMDNWFVCFKFVIGSTVQSIEHFPFDGVSPSRIWSSGHMRKKVDKYCSLFMQANVITRREVAKWESVRLPTAVEQTFNSSPWNCEARGMPYLLSAHSTNTAHTHGEQRHRTHILSGIKWRFKGELRCNRGNTRNTCHHRTNTYEHRTEHSMDGRRCVSNDVSRTKVNLQPMFVYWRDTAADFTSPVETD